MKFLSPIDLAKNQLLNAVFMKATAHPSNPVEGLFYYNTTDKKFYYRTDTDWIDAASPNLSGLITKATLTAQSVLVAVTNATPTAVTVNEQTVVGRVTGGNVSTIAIDDDLTTVSASHDTIPSALAAKNYADTKQSALTFGIANTNAVKIDSADVTNGEFAKFTANGLESRSTAEVLSDIGAFASANVSTATDLGGATPSNTLVPSQSAAKSYIDGIVSAANALVYKGTIDCSANPNYPAADAGHLYVVSAAGKIGGVAGIAVELGDLIICNTDSTASGDEATVGSKWNIVEKNIVGAVSGPASSVDLRIAVFDGLTGKLLKDGGKTISDIENATHTGDVTGSTVLTIADGKVTLTKMANLAANSIIGNNTGSEAVPKALTAAEVRALLNVADGATANTGTVRKVAANIGDAVATNYLIAHNLNSRDISVTVYDNATYASVYVDFEMTDVNNVTIKFASAPDTNAYRVVIMA